MLGLVAFWVKPLDASARKTAIEKIRNLRPPNLVVLIKKSQPHLGGEYLLGMYAFEIDQADQNLRRFKLWQEWPFDLKVHTEFVRCNLESPIRVKRDSVAIYVRRLNPGGVITPFNREDHLVWWAACSPEMAGIDPAELTQKALSLGYSTKLVENQEVLNLPLK